MGEGRQFLRGFVHHRYRGPFRSYSQSKFLSYTYCKKRACEQLTLHVEGGVVHGGGHGGEGLGADGGWPPGPPHPLLTHADHALVRVAHGGAGSEGGDRGRAPFHAWLRWGRELALGLVAAWNVAHLGAVHLAASARCHGPCLQRGGTLLSTTINTQQ